MSKRKRLEKKNELQVRKEGRHDLDLKENQEVSSSDNESKVIDVEEKKEKVHGNFGRSLLALLVVLLIVAAVVIVLLAVLFKE